MAAERYRAWADAPANATHAPALRACAAREVDIAARVEALYPDAAGIEHAIRVANPDLDEINRGLFAGRSFAEQFTIQARGERLGAATWRAFASREADPGRRDALLSCAPLEEENAVALETIELRASTATTTATTFDPPGGPPTGFATTTEGGHVVATQF